MDLERPGQRLPETGDGTARRLVQSFNDMLTRLESERGVSNARALAAQEAERHRIAQELHDEVGQEALPTPPAIPERTPWTSC